MLALWLVGCGGAGPVDASEAARRTEVRLPTFGALDTDDDSQLTEMELVRAALAYHSAWELDEDGLVMRSELARGLFGTLDVDHDDRITAAELAPHAPFVLPPGARRLTPWDRNGDGTVDRHELRLGLDALDVRTLLDADGDGGITDLELTAAVLQHLDADEDGRVDLDEWRAAGGPVAGEVEVE